MQKDILISVIVPIYNVEDYLEKCIDSILSQSYKNFELLLADDGSTDGSAAICDRYAAADDRIRAIHKPNGGVSSARNAGLDVMRGDAVVFIDPDDYIHPLMFETLLDLMVKNDADIALCYTRGTKLRDYDEPDADSYQVKVLSGKQALEKLYSGDTFDFFGYGPTTVVNKLYRRKIFDGGLRFREDARVDEDNIITPYFYVNANKIVSIDRRMYYIYVRPGSLTRKEITPEHMQNLAALAPDVYKKRIALFYQVGYDELARQTYRIALFDLVEKYAQFSDKKARQIIRGGYYELYRAAKRDGALSIKNRIVLGGGISPAIYRVFYKVLKK